MNHIKYFLAIIGAGLVITGLVFVMRQPQKVVVEVPNLIFNNPQLPEQNSSFNLGGEFGPTYDILGTKNALAYVATTTATTTQAFQIGGDWDQLTVNIKSDATTTVNGLDPKLSWYYEFCDQSATNNCSDSGAIWLGEDTKSVSGSVVTHQTPTTTHDYVLPNGGIHGKQVDVLNMNHEWVRVTVYRARKFLNAGVYMYLKPKNLTR